MSLSEFATLLTCIAGFLLILSAVSYAITGGRGDFFIGPLLFGVLTTVASIIFWITFGISINDQNLDENYCESLETRGHDTQFFVYNIFNHECFIKVDGQWLEIRNSPFDRGIK